MATYNELYDLRQNSGLINRISIAVSIKAQVYVDLPTPTMDQLNWAAKVLTPSSGRTEAEKLLQYILGKNNGLDVTQITGSSDSAVQTAVDAAVDALVGGGII